MQHEVLIAGVHENPVPIHHNRREEISMEIDEVQQVLNKEEERQIEEMDVSDIVVHFFIYNGCKIDLYGRVSLVKNIDDN